MTRRGSTVDPNSGKGGKESEANEGKPSKTYAASVTHG